MSDGLEAPRKAAQAMMKSATEAATTALALTAETAFRRAVEALSIADTQDEILRIRDGYVGSIVFFSETPYVSRR